MDEAKKKIEELINKYEQVLGAHRIGDYTEQDTKNVFITPLFEALGWDISSKDDVSAEESQKSGGRVDYGFYLNSRLVFYLEAKPLRADLDKEEYARQAITYSWNKGVDYAVLTDFEGLKIFNAQLIEGSVVDRLIFEISYKNYLEDFDRLWLLSKQSFSEKLLDKYADKYGKKLKRVSVGNKLYKDIQECRELLTESFRIYNDNLTSDLIDEGVQKLLNRLVFLRVAEDRGIEPPILKELVHGWQSSGKDRKDLYQTMIAKFRELDGYYNSNLFSPHSFENWEEHDQATEDVIEILHGKKGNYEYDFKFIPADILGGVYENYLGHRLEKSKKGITIAKDAKKRKEQGIYYTPDFIVDYIVKNTLGPVLEKCRSMADLKKIKVLDPACGSGSFLVKAIELIAQKYKDFNAPDDVNTRLQILSQNIYGVDLDDKAIEIARLNLLVSAFEKREELPLLDNIKNGNSLISGTDEELKKYFGKNFRDKKPFNWQEEFPEVFKQGGFDVIIGNPPYLKELDNKELFQEIRKSNFGKYYQGKMDFWYFFLHRSIEVLKDDGIMAFITNSYFLKSTGATKLIDHLQDETVLVRAVDFQNIKVFGDVSGRHLIHIWQKTKDKSNAITKYIKINKDSFREIVEDKYIELPYAEIIKDSSINFEANIKINEDNLLLGGLFDVSQGVVEATDKISKKISLQIRDKELKYGDGVFVLSEQELEKLNLNDKEKSVIKKYLNTNDIRRYRIDFHNEYLIYSDKETKSRISSGEYPHIKSHLDKMGRFITSSNAPYGLHRPRDDKYFENPKLICKGMFLSPEFCFDDEKYYVGFSFSVILEKNKDYDLKYLLGLLNSSFGGNWFNVNGKKRGVGVDIGVAMFRNFPVCKANKVQQKRIITLVDKIISLNKEFHEVPEHSDKWGKLKSEIEKTDKKIDEEVYKLYGLTEEEIKIVEPDI